MKVRIRAVEYYPVFELEELKPDEKDDQLTITLTSNEVYQIRRTHDTWNNHQEKLRKLHPWF